MNTVHIVLTWAWFLLGWSLAWVARAVLVLACACFAIALIVRARRLAQRLARRRRYRRAVRQTGEDALDALTRAARNWPPESYARRPSAAVSVVHRCPIDGSGGLMPCCGLTPFEVSRWDRITQDDALVTCEQPIPYQIPPSVWDEWEREMAEGSGL